MIWRTEDVDLIRSIALHPRAWKRIASDGMTQEDYHPVIHPRVHYLTDGHGFVEWTPLTNVAYQAHIVHLGDALPFAREAVDWIFAEGARKLVAMVPSYNWHAAKLAENVGFQLEHTLTSAVQWRGRMCDLLILGMSDGISNRRDRGGADRGFGL